VVAASVLATFAALPLVLGEYRTTLLLPVFGYGVALLGLNLLLGYGGLVSFGHAMFVAIGAYAAAVTVGVWRIASFEVALLAAAAAGLLVALPVGALCSRYTKIFFGMLTLAFGMLFHSFLFKFYALTGGDQACACRARRCSAWSSRSWTRRSSWSALTTGTASPSPRCSPC
jgi:branched-chain amino acid transport system permease protein